MKIFSLILGILFLSIFFIGLIQPSICSLSGNCLSNINFYLVGGIGLLLLLFSINLE